MILDLLIAFAYSALAGLLSSAMLARPRPWPPLALAAGACGWSVAFAADEIAGFHALHPFRPESLIPATALAFVLLLGVRRYAERKSRRRTIFF